ncbi:DUF2570 family protein [Serratia sp. DD3]|uniref:DUF2570 family protein n=1 Tax=Serratia sp. DD3 TaxID=1410619 RepID=UPI0003C506F1|nr:DUF2570 family protein [Serratia sp. DD3]KEY56944.1 hypothetical protein SRDD_41930 [Serratia sp. DD3]
MKLGQYGLIGALLVAICLGWYSTILSSRLDTAKELLAEQSKSLAQQAALIGTLQTQDAQNRALLAAQQQKEQQLRQQASDNQRRYRDATKNDQCAVTAAPGAVIELLQ